MILLVLNFYIHVGSYIWVGGVGMYYWRPLLQQKLCWISKACGKHSNMKTSKSSKRLFHITKMPLSSFKMQRSEFVPKQLCPIKLGHRLIIFQVNVINLITKFN